MTSPLIIQCPKCKDYFEVVELKCGVFVHGVYLKTMTPIRPHANLSKIKKKDTIGCLARLKVSLNKKREVTVIEISDDESERARVAHER